MPNEYFIRRLNKLAFQARKFKADSNSVQEVYTLSIVPGKKPGDITLTCDCKAGVHRPWQPCKHTQMVAQFLQAGEPEPFSVEG